MVIGALHNGFQLNQKDIDAVVWDDGTKLELSLLSDGKKEKLRDGRIIDLIDYHVDADATIKFIALSRCVGLADATTLKHNADKCTQLTELYVYGFVQIADDGITAIIEKIRKKLKPPSNRLSIIVQNWLCSMPGTLGFPRLILTEHSNETEPNGNSNTASVDDAPPPAFPALIQRWQSSSQGGQKRKWDVVEIDPFVKLQPQFNQRHRIQNKPLIIALWTTFSACFVCRSFSCIKYVISTFCSNPAPTCPNMRPEY